MDATVTSSAVGPGKARTARQRAREEITAEILGAARARLAVSGPGELSLRAVARDVGMVSSAVYRYFASRDQLLTALLISAYDELGTVAEAADDAVADRGDCAVRWQTTCRAVRDWAVDHPHDYALLYGSPSVISLTSLLYVRAQLPSQLGGLGSNVVFIDGENTAELPSENLALTDFMGTEGRQNGLILSQIS